MGYAWQERLKEIVEKEAEEEEQQQEPAATKEEEEQQQEVAADEEQQQNDDERYDTVATIKLVFVRRKTRERIPGDWKFKQPQHKDGHGQHHTTY